MRPLSVRQFMKEDFAWGTDHGLCGKRRRGRRIRIRTSSRSRSGHKSKAPALKCAGVRSQLRPGPEISLAPGQPRRDKLRCQAVL